MLSIDLLRSKLKKFGSYASKIESYDLNKQNRSETYIGMIQSSAYRLQYIDNQLSIATIQPDLSNNQADAYSKTCSRKLSLRLV